MLSVHSYVTALDLLKAGASISGLDMIISVLSLGHCQSMEITGNGVDFPSVSLSGQSHRD